MDNLILLVDRLTGFVFKKHIKTTTVSIVTSILLIVSVHILLRMYFEQASSEVVDSWYQSEIVSIQQGNILSSVSKLQRTLNRSSIIKGVKVVDSNGLSLIQFGKDFDTTKDEKNVEQFSIKRKIWFSSIYCITINSSQIHILSESNDLFFAFIIVSIYLISITFVFAIYLQRVAIAQEKLQSEAELDRLKMQSEFDRTVVEMSRRLAHDIRSPLSLLNAVGKKIEFKMPEEGYLLSEVSSRIIQIADGILDFSREKKDEKKSIQTDFIDMQIDSSSSFEIVKVCAQVIKEKEIVSSNEKVKFQFYNEINSEFSVFCQILDLQRILSNILTNSIEAITDIGTVSITVSENPDALLIEIRDNGIGMKQELIDNVYKMPISYGKPNGNGIGLWSSIKILNSWNSSHLDILSDEYGTKISITLGKS